ncbi:MAG: MFS transporter [Proteobacteria bacterium]|nr:MFS transporter [Pseudomonadota bacterium]
MNFPRNLLIVMGTTFVAFCTLYAPQPMLPMLAEQFSISSADAGLLMTVTLLPLGFAPVVYGYFLQAIPAKLMLSIALSLLMLDQFAFYFVSEFWHLLVLRALQGVLLSAIFTALMTYCATMVAKDRIRNMMGWYIGATIVGGFGGRVIGGFFATLFDWRTAFVVLGAMLIVPVFFMRFVNADAEINFAHLDTRTVFRVLKDHTFRYSYLSLFCVFFVFAGVLNVLPFRLQEIDASVSPLRISSLYIGYLIGVPVAIFSQRIMRRVGDDKKGLLLGLLLYATGLLAFLVADFTVLLVMIFGFAAGFFFIHSTLSGLVNHLVHEHKGVVNGLYVSIYYISGALGSWLPGYLYDHAGWNSLMLVFFSVLILAAWLMMQLRLSGQKGEASG